MDNMKLWEEVKTPPQTALKEIKGGRLSGKSDINPMWRIKTLTEQFGPCGIGWKYVITKQWLENGGDSEIAAFVNIDLFIKVEGEWSDAIPGTGGSSFVTKESKGPYTSDECFKMALTDAISVSCKALGIAADVYWQLGSIPDEGRDKDKNKVETPTDAQIKTMINKATLKKISMDDVKQKALDLGAEKPANLSMEGYKTMCKWIDDWQEEVAI